MDSVLLQRLAELEAQNQRLEAFSRAVAANLKGPLYQIAGYTRVLRDVHTALSAAQLHDRLEMIRNKAREAIAIVDGLILAADHLATASKATDEHMQLAELTLEAMTLAEAITIAERTSDAGLVAAETQEASKGNGDARSYRLQGQPAGSGADREGYDDSGNGGRPTVERRD